MPLVHTEKNLKLTMNENLKDLVNRLPHRFMVVRQNYKGRLFASDNIKEIVDFIWKRENVSEYILLIRRREYDILDSNTDLINIEDRIRHLLDIDEAFNKENIDIRTND